jgi:ABC-2 type transport system permease protein
MKRALVLAWSYLRLAMMNELQYRVNFFIQLFESALALLTALVVLALVYSHTNNLAGWQRGELHALLGVFTMLMALLQTSIQPNVVRLLSDIQQGTFDFVLVKPIDAQWQVSIREVRVWQLVDFAAGAAIMGHALWQMHAQLSLMQVVLFALTLSCGALLIYCVMLLLASLAFWAVRIDTVFEIIESITGAGRMPTDIYPRWMRIILTFVVPLAFAVTVPAQVITNRATLTDVLTQLGVTALFMLFTRLVWQKAVAHYNGASA